MSPPQRIVGVLSLILVPLTARAATVTVTGVGDAIAVDGSVTLREAITSINNAANASADVVPVGVYGTGDTINFSIAGAGVHIIVPVSVLPTLSKPVLLDGYSQPGSSANTLAVGDDAVINIHLKNPVSPTLTSGLSLGAGSDGTAIRGFAIQGFSFGITISASNSAVEGCFVGLDPTGANGFGNQVGINLTNGAVGGNTIGGSIPAKRNVISGNNGAGLVINSELPASPNLVLGNYIGTNLAGTTALPNLYGIYMGTLGGINAAGPVIGGSTATPGQGAGNVISGNTDSGITVMAQSGSVFGAGTIAGNIIGLNAAGTAPIGNGSYGIYLYDQPLSSGGAATLGPVAIGGATPAQRNVISGNIVAIGLTASATTIRGNYIGTDVTGLLARPNTNGAIFLSGVGAFAGDVTIGGPAAADGNVIAGNSGDAINVTLATATIQSNFIGVDANGNALGNAGYGVQVNSGLATVGGARGNIIANNGQTGVDVRITTLVHNASDAAVLNNDIYLNGLGSPPLGRMGINLGADLVTPNDPGDGDTGPNGLQNYPVLTAASVESGSVTVTGSLDSTPNTTYRIDVLATEACEANGFGEGHIYLGSDNVATGPGGTVSFSLSPFVIPGGLPSITVTATNPSNQTSEFSQCILTTLGGSSPEPVTGEIVFNATTSGDQVAPRVAYSAAGGFLAVWQSPNVDGSGAGIVARRFASKGQALGGELLVNQTTVGDQALPAVASDDAGNTVVVWEGDDANGRGVFLRMFDSAGNPLTGEIAVNATTAGQQLAPTVAINESGVVLVAWQGAPGGGSPDLSGSAILGRFFALGSATPTSAELTINTTTGGDQTNADAAGFDLSGAFVVAWEGPDADGRGIFAQRLLPTGTAAGPELAVNATTAGDQERPSVAASGREPDPGAINDFVIVWQSPDSDGHGIVAQRFDQADGSPDGGEQTVNQIPDGDQTSPRVAVDDGLRDDVLNFVTTWICTGVCLPLRQLPTEAMSAETIAGAPILVRGRRIGGPGRGAADGSVEFTINTSAASHSRPSIASQRDGDFVVAWQSSGQDGSGETVLGRAFEIQRIFKDGFEAGATTAWSGIAP